MNKYYNQNIIPLVTVCVPTFQHSKYIEETLNGIVMQQVNFTYEVIVHDDASTDGTQDKIIRFSEAYPNLIKIIFQDNNQLSRGNKPIWEFVYPDIKSKYIAICDGDDYWIDPFKLQKQVDFMEKNEHYSLCASRTKLIDENSKIIGEGPTLDLLRVDRHDENLRLFENYSLKDYLYYPYNIFQYSSVLFRNIPGLTQNMDRNIHTGDLLLSVNLLKDGLAYFFLDDYFSAYRIHSNGVWNRNGNLRKALIKVADYKRLKEIIPEHIGEINKTLKCLYNEISIEYARDGKIFYSLYNYILSLDYDSELISENGIKRLYNLIFHYKGYYSGNYIKYVSGKID